MSTEIDTYYQAYCNECNWYGIYTYYDEAHDAADQHEEEYHND